MKRPGGILGDIIDAKARRIAAGEFRVPPGRGLPPRGAAFEEALGRPGPQILAEIKHRSPSAGLILPDAAGRIEDVAISYARGGAAALSVVIEKDSFGGDPSWLSRARRASGLPVLMKDFVFTVEQLDFAVQIGADAVLLIVSVLEPRELAHLLAEARARGLAALVEAHSEDELGEALASGASIVGVNARNLSTFAVDLAAMARIGRLFPEGCLPVAESGIHSPAGVRLLSAAGYRAFLVGESLLRATSQSAGVRRLRGIGTTDVKICGVTRLSDVALCEELGADYLGVNMSAASPRRVSEETACALAGAARLARPVLVFYRNSLEEIERITRNVKPHAIQVADDPPGLSSLDLGVPIWRTFPASEDGFARARQWTRGLPLFDAVSAGEGGGTGRRVDLSLFGARPVPGPFALAGGLASGNVAEAIRRARPDIVDVASGVEASPGIKDRGRVRDFVDAVRATVLEVE